MIALGIIAIITTLALPSYRMIIEKRQVTRAAEEIKSFLTAAQLEAVKRNEVVAVSFNGGGGDWCLGMMSASARGLVLEPTASLPDFSCDCTVGDSCLIGAPDEGQALRIFQSGSLSYPEALVDGSVGPSTVFEFDAIRGFALVPGRAMNFELLSDKGNYALNVGTMATGRVEICSDLARASNEVPGFDPC